MQVELFFRQEGKDWADLSNRELIVVKGRTEIYFEFVAYDSDPKATFIVQFGYDTGKIKFTEFQLKSTGKTEENRYRAAWKVPGGCLMKAKT
jgi:hypothetical protein